MTDSLVERVLVAGDRVVRIAIDTADRPASISVELSVDGSRVRGWEEPGWREVGLGCASGYLYWWSARRIVVLDPESPSIVEEIEYDEDVLLAYFLGERDWLIVAETSLCMVRAGVATSRVEFGDVIATCVRRGDRLAVQAATGRWSNVEIRPDGLRVSE